MPDVWLITGIPGAGKTTAARLLATRSQRGVHIEGDRLQEWVVSGGVGPGAEPSHEAARQQRLNVHNQCLLARSCAEAGFDVAIDYLIASRSLLQEFLGRLSGLSVSLVVLAPGKAVAEERDRARVRSQQAESGAGIAGPRPQLEDDLKAELGGMGFWVGNARLTPEQTVDVILANRVRARLAT